MLAAAMGNGEIQLFSVPHPNNLEDEKNPVVIDLAPTICCSSSGHVPLVLNWGCVSTNEEFLAVGYDSGN